MITRRQRRTPRKAGQVLLFLLMVLGILFFVVLWNYDVHKIVFVKTISRNGGDAAALVAARWQGVTLNLIGDLNLLHAAATGTDKHEETEAAILGTQARLCFVGPMIAFMAAQQAAKNNGIFQNDDFSAWLRLHAEEVRSDYTRRSDPTDPNSPMLFPEPYPDAWKEYANMLGLIADDGVAAGPDNAQYFNDYAGGHYLLMPGFYEAIASKDWCWFYHDAPTLLKKYRNFFPCWWDALPRLAHAQYINSEIFGVGLRTEANWLSDLVDHSTMARVAAERDISVGFTGSDPAVWYCYDSALWENWTAMTLSGSDPLPLTGQVRPQYNYTGADAAVRVEATATRLTPGAGGSKISSKITWTAAAKPFGYLNHDERPDHYPLLLPAFHEARLIPIDASSAPAGGTYNLDWRRHIEQHLQGPIYDYMSRGPGGPAGCWYCSQLRTWEDASFRQEGADWLDKNSKLCVETVRGRAGGGSRHGH